jgi:HAD superfamily hydrolase (TIGR01509 family)
MPVRAVLFDLDDTLIDWSGFTGNWYETEPRHLTYVYDYITSEVGALRVNADGFIEEFTRRAREGWRNARETMVSPHIGNLLVDTAAWLGAPRDKLDTGAVMDSYRWQVVPGTNPFPEVHAVLSQLRSDGIVLGLITNSYLPMRMRDAELIGHDLIDFFNACRYSAADAGYLKPHANVFMTALKSIGIAPSEAIFVGDSLTADVMGAKGVGMRAVWRMHDNSATAPDMFSQPDYIVRTLEEIPALLAQWAD